MASRPVAGRVGAALLLVSVPMAAWWLIGDLSESPYADYYTLKPLQLRFGDERVFGVVATVVAIVGLGLLVASRPRLRSKPSSWELAVGAVAAAEVTSVYIYRVITAGVIGANIGAGMMFMFGVPIVGFLLAWALELIESKVVVGSRTLSVPAIGVGVTLVHFVIGIALPWASPAFLAVVLAIVAQRVLTSARVA
jgi:hypothetical protein